MYDTLSLGERIALLRKRRGWTQRYLGNLVDLSQTDVWRIENGHTKNPHWKRMCAFADVFGITLDSLRGKLDADSCGVLGQSAEV